MYRILKQCNVLHYIYRKAVLIENGHQMAQTINCLRNIENQRATRQSVLIAP